MLLNNGKHDGDNSLETLSAYNGEGSYNYIPDSLVGTLRVLHEAAGCKVPRWNPRLSLSKLSPDLQVPRASSASLSLRCKGGKGKKEAFPLPEGAEGRLEPATLGVLACISWKARFFSHRYTYR